MSFPKYGELFRILGRCSFEGSVYNGPSEDELAAVVPEPVTVRLDGAASPWDVSETFLAT